MMQIDKKHIFLAGFMTFLLFLAGCGLPTIAGNSPTPTQTLQNSANAMSKLNSVHVDLQTQLNATSGSANNGVTFNITGHGDAAAPDQASINLMLGQSPLLAVVSKGQTAYVQVKNGSWYSFDKSKLQNNVQNFFSQSLATHMGQILAVVQNAKLVDHGQETLNGTSLDHITATLDQQTLQSLSQQLNGLLPSTAQSTQNQIKQATLDAWVDQATWYTHRAVLDVVTQIDAGVLQQETGQSTGSSSVLPVEVKVQVDFSKFNQPVNIQAPANAIPFTK